MVFVHTLNFPLGVTIGITFIPPVCTSLYKSVFVAVAAVLEAGALQENIAAQANSHIIFFIS